MQYHMPATVKSVVLYLTKRRKEVSLAVRRGASCPNWFHCDRTSMTVHSTLFSRQQNLFTNSLLDLLQISTPLLTLTASGCTQIITPVTSGCTWMMQTTTAAGHIQTTTTNWEPISNTNIMHLVSNTLYLHWFRTNHHLHQRVKQIHSSISSVFFSCNALYNCAFLCKVTVCKVYYSLPLFVCLCYTLSVFTATWRINVFINLWLTLHHTHTTSICVRAGTEPSYRLIWLLQFQGSIHLKPMHFSLGSGSWP